MIHYEESFPVRYYETDQMGIVHHTNYIRYFECARSGMMKSWGYPIEESEKDGFLMPIVDVRCRYRHSAKMGDVVTAVAEIENLPLAKLYIRQRVLNQEGKLCAEGVVTLGFLDTATGRPIPCPEKIYNIMKQQFNQ